MVPNFLKKKKGSNISGCWTILEMFQVMFETNGKDCHNLSDNVVFKFVFYSFYFKSVVIISYYVISQSQVKGERLHQN